MASSLKVDSKAVREDAVRRAEAQFKEARTTEQRHRARGALARARRAATPQEG